MKKKSIGIIGAGKHFVEKIFPVISNSSYFKINGILKIWERGEAKIKPLDSTAAK